MRFMAMTALYPADMETDRINTRFNASVIVSMNCHACRVTTGAGQLVELKMIYCFIVRILRNRIVKISIKGYHKHVSAVVKHRLEHAAGTKL